MGSSKLSKFDMEEMQRPSREARLEELLAERLVVIAQLVHLAQ